MTEPVKDNARIAADHEAFQAAYARARQAFGQIDGVIGVGFGLKQTGGDFKDDIAIVVFVGEKKPDADLSPAERIPTSFEGYRTDVRIAPRVRPGACDNTATYSTIQGGIQITPKGTTTAPNTIVFNDGTLGCIVRRRNDASRENVYVLSNKHVMHTPTSGVDDYVYHPYGPGAENKDSNTLGPVQRGGVYGDVPFVVTPGSPPQNFFIDCAIARLDIDSKCCGSTCTKDKTKYDTTIIDLQVGTPNANTLSDVRSVIGLETFAGATVVKVGRTTGKTFGRVVGVHTDFPCLGDPSVPGSANFTAHNGLEIEFLPTSGAPQNCKGHTWFAETGDSGSIVVDEQGAVVGIISQVPDPLHAGPNDTAIACHIVPVLDQLGICIPCTTGTSHGSSRATDGSGLQPVRHADAAGPDGQIEFGLEEVVSVPVRQVTDAEAARMRELLAAFRQTAIGRDLHDTFGDVRREIGYLVRNVKRVTIAWHKHQGPAFLAHALNHVAGETSRVPREVNGVTRHALLLRMREVLYQHGSNPLRAALDTYGDRLLAMDEHCDTVAECLAWLQAAERV